MTRMVDGEVGMRVVASGRGRALRTSTALVGVGLAAMIGVAPLVVATPAQAQVLNFWQNGTSDYGTAGNWSNGVPGSGHHAEFENTGHPP